MMTRQLTARDKFYLSCSHFTTPFSPFLLRQFLTWARLASNSICSGR